MNQPDIVRVILPEASPWFGHLLADELRARGFLVTTAGNAASADQVELVASSASGLLAERRFFVKGTESVFLYSAVDFEDSLRDATRDMVDQIVSGIVQLIDQYPMLGRVTNEEQT